MLERNDGGVRRSDGLGGILDLEVRLVVGTSNAELEEAVALEECLGMAAGVRDE